MATLFLIRKDDVIKKEAQLLDMKLNAEDIGDSEATEALIDILYALEVREEALMFFESVIYVPIEVFDNEYTIRDILDELGIYYNWKLED